MVFKRFRLQCALRVALLALSLALFVYLALRTTLYATLLLAGALIVYQVVALIRYVEQTNRQLTRFLQSIAYADLSQTFTGRGLGASFQDLYAAFSEVASAFRKIRAEREEQYRYLQTVVQHVGVGVMVFQPDGTVELMNNAARRLLRVSGAGKIPHLSVLEASEKQAVETLRGMRAGDRALVRVGELQLALHAAEFRMQERRLMLVSIQNIQSELEEKELEAWHTLIRVLTHEIMNSVTPIASLASTANDLIRTETGPDAGHDEAREDIRTALQAIQTRCEGLLHFIDAYRTLTRIPPPEFQIVPVQTLFGRVERLMHPQMAAQRITLSVSVAPAQLDVTADPELIEQVLINLVTNAMQALADRPQAAIRLHGGMNGQGRVVIQVTDNGPGILSDVQEKIFIPFFTTKQDGSGIGLSLSRQIMRLHRGTITVRSIPDVETTFTLRF
jgi:nitrogen fixation/metabolism regulation signal transduction histidine kinase